MTDTPDDQAARWARREPLLVTMSRMRRGVLLEQERDLLAAQITTELADGDQARAQLADYEDRITWETNCGEHARLLDSCRAADERAEKAERNAKRAEKRCEDLRGESLRRGAEVVERNERIAKLEQRAERAEATLTAVRKAVAVALQHENPLGLTCVGCGVNHLAAALTALGDPQPAAEPEPSTEERPSGTHLCHDTDPVTLKECALTHDHTGGHRDANTTWPPHCGESHIRDGKVWHCLQGPNHGGRHVGANGGLLRIQWPLPGEHENAEPPAEPQPDRRPNCRCTVTASITPEQPAEPDGAALWAAIRDHAAADTEWRRKITQPLRNAIIIAAATARPRDVL